MFRLAQQVGSHVFGIGAFIGDDQHLRGASYHIDVQCTIRHALRGGHIGIARPHQLIDFGDEACSIGQRRHRLGTSHGYDPVHTGNFCRRQHCIIEVFRRRGHHDELLYSSHLGGNGIHQYGGGIGRRSAGHI